MKNFKLISLLLCFLGVALGSVPNSLSASYYRNPVILDCALLLQTPPAGATQGNGLNAEILLSSEVDEDEDETHDNKPFSEGLFTFNSHIQNQAYTTRKLIPVDAWKNACWLRFLVLRL